MADRHAQILDDSQFERLYTAVSKGDHGLRDRVMILLSYKAGLRAKEIAGLTWAAVSDADGVITHQIMIGSRIAKGGRERCVPMHPALAVALRALRDARPCDTHICYSTRGPSLSANAVAVWFSRLYESEAFLGCSSHSGRRTFITHAARRANLVGCSLRDVQRLAGHARLETTERYIELSPQAHQLVNSL